jgi:hypothetical protein
MRWAFAAVENFCREPSLPADERRTYRLHLVYALLDAAAGGIIANAPVVAIKQMGAPTWQLGLSLTLSGVGMIATLYLSHWMASKPKMPFVFIPGLACGACTAAMAMTSNSLLFLLLSGLGLLFSTLTRPAIAAVLRANYSVTHRGHATGEIRKWSSLAFLVAFLVTAGALDLVAQHPMAMVRSQVVLAGLLSLASHVCFRQIHVRETIKESSIDLRPRLVESLHAAIQVISQNSRYRRYLLVCFLYGFSGLMYVSYLPAFFQKDLHYNYAQCALLLEVIPGLASFAMTGTLGRWFDRSNPWTAWAWICLAWGLDPLLLAATPFCALVIPLAAWLLPVTARVSRGCVQGGSWVLWWQIGVNHFAASADQTGHYLGILVFLNGLMRILAPPVGAWLLFATDSSRPVLFLCGGLGVLLAGAYALAQARRETQDKRLATMVDFETQLEDVSQKV